MKVIKKSAPSQADQAKPAGAMAAAIGSAPSPPTSLAIKPTPAVACTPPRAPTSGPGAHVSPMLMPSLEPASPTTLSALASNSASTSSSASAPTSQAPFNLSPASGHECSTSPHSSAKGNDILSCLVVFLEETERASPSSAIRFSATPLGDDTKRDLSSGSSPTTAAKVAPRPANTSPTPTITSTSTSTSTPAPKPTPTPTPTPTTAGPAASSTDSRKGKSRAAKKKIIGRQRKATGKWKAKAKAESKAIDKSFAETALEHLLSTDKRQARVSAQGHAGKKRAAASVSTTSEDDDEARAAHTKRRRPLTFVRVDSPPPSITRTIR